MRAETEVMHSLNISFFRAGLMKDIDIRFSYYSMHSHHWVNWELQEAAEWLVDRQWDRHFSQFWGEVFEIKGGLLFGLQSQHSRLVLP